MEDISRISVTEQISYIKATQQPLSSDVVIIEGEKNIWLFDVGCRPKINTFLEQYKKPKKIILSHFHSDHIGNWKYLNYDELYFGKYTGKYIKTGTIIERETIFEDGVKLKIMPLACSHAKGSLILVVNDEYTFLGDAVYPAIKGEKYGYNQQFLQQEIEQLEALECSWFLLSHSKKFIYKKKAILHYLKNIYANRKAGNAFIEVPNPDYETEAMTLLKKYDE